MKQDDNKTEIRNSAFIPLGMNFVKEIAKELMPEAERKGLSDFMRIIRLLFHFEYLESRDKLKRNFDIVTAHQDDNEALIDVMKESKMTPSEFLDVSVDFVSDFCTLLADANFSLLTQKEWELAKAEDFMFTLPCDIAWDKFDKELLGTFLKQNPALSEGLTQFADAALLFKRGNGRGEGKGHVHHGEGRDVPGDVHHGASAGNRRQAQDGVRVPRRCRKETHCDSQEGRRWQGVD